MRVDREAFLLAVAALASACERADDQTRPGRIDPVEVKKAEPPAPEPPAPVPDHEPVAAFERIPLPKEAPKPAVAIRPVSAAKRWFFALDAVQRTNVASLCKYRVENPCAGLFARLPKPRRAVVAEEQVAEEQVAASTQAATPVVPPKTIARIDDEDESGEEKFLAGLDAAQRAQANTYCGEVNRGMPSPSCETPLVAAFEGQPVEFTPATGREQFAFVPGEPMATDWPTATTPWIARDLDHDGAITSGAELFGSSTAIPGGTARNGYDALAALDANGDGLIDRRDPAFTELLLWSDKNGDHRSSPDELRPLSSVVAAIPLAHSVDARCTIRGACEGERGKLRWRDASGAEREGAVIDVYLPRR